MAFPSTQIPAIPFNPGMIQAARAADAAAMGVARQFGNAASTYGSNQFNGISNFIAQVFGANDLSGFDPATQNWIRYGIGQLSQTGMIPGFVDMGNVQDLMLQSLRTTGQMQGNPVLQMEMAKQLADFANADIWSANGTVNYGFTGGLDSDMAVQFYTHQVNSMLRSGDLHVGGARVALASGENLASRRSDMMRNIHAKQAEGTMSASEAARYNGANASLEAMGSETAARLAVLANEAGGYNKITLKGDDLRKALLRDDLAGKYGSLSQAEKDAAGRGLANFAERDVALEAVAAQTLDDYNNGDVNSRVLGRRLIGDASQADIIKGLLNDDLSIMQIGTTTRLDGTGRAGGVGAADYIEQLDKLVAASGMGVTASSKEKLNNIKKARDVLKGRGVNLSDKNVALEAISGELSLDDVPAALRAGFEDLRKIVDGGSVELEGFDNGTKEVAEKAREMFSKYGAGLKLMQDTFGAKSFAELQQKARDLNWGNLANPDSLDRMNSGMSDVFGIAQASSRSIEQVLMERKDIVKALAALSGGAKYVSEDEISAQQLAKQYSDADELAGSRYSSQERFAMMKRSHENAKANFGAADAAEHLLNTKAGRFTGEMQTQLRGKIERMNKLLASDNLEDREEARVLNNSIKNILNQGGFDDDEIRMAANQFGESRVDTSVRQGAVIRYRNDLRKRRFNGKRLFDNGIVDSMSDIMSARLDLLGSSETEWSKFVDAATKGDKAFDTYLQSSGLSGDDLKKAKALRRQVTSLRSSNSVAFETMKDAVTPQVVVGSAQRSRQLNAQWDAFMKSGDYSSSITPTGNFVVDMIRAATDGKQLSGADLLMADTYKLISNSGAKYNGGKTALDRAKAVNDQLSENRQAWGNAIAVGTEADGTISAKSFSALLDSMGLSKTERDKAMSEFNAREGKGARQQSAYVTEFMQKHGMTATAKDGVVLFAGAENMAEQTRLVEREMKAQQRINLKDALKDGNVTQEELADILKKDPTLGRINEEGVYEGDMLSWKGKTLADITDSKNAYGLNYENSDGRTNAQNIANMQDTTNTGQAMVDATKEILDFMKNTFTKSEPATGRESASSGSGAPPAPEGGADGTSNNG